MDDVIDLISDEELQLSPPRSLPTMTPLGNASNVPIQPASEPPAAASPVGDSLQFLTETRNSELHTGSVRRAKPLIRSMFSGAIDPLDGDDENDSPRLQHIKPIDIDALDDDKKDDTDYVEKTAAEDEKMNAAAANPATDDEDDNDEDLLETSHIQRLRQLRQLRLVAKQKENARITSSAADSVGKPSMTSVLSCKRKREAVTPSQTRSVTTSMPSIIPPYAVSDLSVDFSEPTAARNMAASSTQGVRATPSSVAPQAEAVLRTSARDLRRPDPSATAPPLRPASSAALTSNPDTQPNPAKTLPSIDRDRIIDPTIAEDDDDLSNDEVPGSVVQRESESESKPGLAISTKFANELVDLNEKCSDATREVPTPHELNITLLTHQRQALAWMIKREDEHDMPAGHPRGGILADDQGFGKTLSLIGLMLSNKPAPCEETEERRAWGNLVIAPTSILNQWAQELRDRIDEIYHPKVLIYHGAKRTKDPHDLIDYDVVITSYGTLLQDYPRAIEWQGASKRSAVKRRRPTGALYKVRWYRVILDEAQSIKNRHSHAHRAAVLLDAKCRWAVTGTPIQNTVDDMYSLFLFLGYHVVDSYVEWKAKFKFPLEASRSEACRNRAFARFQAILGVILLRRAKHDKINGKPVMDLPPRNVRTIELEFAKNELTHYRAMEVSAVREINSLGDIVYRPQGMAFFLVILLRLRQACSHAKLCEWDSPFAFDFTEKELDIVEEKMKTQCLFRRLPKETQDRLYRELGPDSKIPQTCPICIDCIANDGVVTLCGHIFCSSDFENWSKDNDTCPTCRQSLGGENEVMFLADVRKEVHALARKAKREDEEKQKEIKEELQVEKKNKFLLRLLGNEEDADDEDDIKPKEIKKRRKLEDGKAEPSVVEFDDDSSLLDPVKAERANDEAVEETEDTDMGTSTKIKAFLEETDKIMKTTSDKVLCFSQWTRMLDLVEEQLEKTGYEYVRLDGSQSLEQRNTVVRIFNNRSKCRLFLISLKAGSTGLNLTAANHVFLLDCWWNPAVEEQAIDRVHRIGQDKAVEVVKMKIANTVEEKILKLQEKKRAIADGVLGFEGLKMLGRRRLTMNDVLGLFEDVYENVAIQAQQQQDSTTVDIVQNVVQLSRDLRTGW